MAGRGRDATLSPWPAGGVPGAPGIGGQHGPGGAPGRPPSGSYGWPQMQPHQGQPGPGVPPGAQPWGGPYQPGPPLQGLQRPPYGGPPSAGFPGQGRPAGPGSHPMGQDQYGGPGLQSPYPGHAALGSKPMGGFPTPPPHGLQRPVQPYSGQPAMHGATMQAHQAAQVPAAKSPAKSVWTEHNAPDGRKYYYNSVTKTSSWTKPAELSQPAADPAQSDWKEFTAPDGRKYYYNRVTKQSKWQMPEELRQAQAAAGRSTPKSASVQVLKLQQPSPTGTPPANGNLLATPSSVKEESRLGVKAEDPGRSDLNVGLPEPRKLVVYNSKEEAKQAFKELLVSVGTTSQSTWEATMRLIANDPRYQAFRTIGEKKACFNEYLQQRAREEKEEGRMRAKQAREDFATLLELSPELKAGTRYSKAAALFEDEPRWQAVKDLREREQLFNEHMKERERKEKEQRKAETRKRKAAFRALLQSMKSIKVDSLWRKTMSTLEGEEEYVALDKPDRLEVFQAHIWDLEKEYKARKEKDKKEAVRQERRNRDAFKALLRQHLDAGIIKPKMLWKEYHRIAKSEDALKVAERNVSGSRPRELFEDVLEEVEERFSADKSRLQEVKGFDLTVDSSFEDYSRAVDAHEDGRLDDVPEMHRKLFFEEEVGRLRERLAKEEKRKQRAKEDFQHLLRDTRRISHNTSWSEAKSLLEKEPEYKSLHAEEREALFTSHIEKLAAKWEKQKLRDKEKEKEREREKEKEKEKEEKKSSRHHDEDRPRKDKKRHKKEKSSDKDKAAEKKTRDKEHQSTSKRRQESSAEDKKHSKRHKKAEEDTHLAEQGRMGDGSGDHSIADADPPKEKEPLPSSQPSNDGKKGSDAEDGEL